MATYNCAEYIGETIESILNQTYTDWELIIIDDASTDDTFFVVEEYKDSRIRYMKNSVNSGLAFSLNVGIRMSKGEFICRMDSDDIMYEDRIEKQIDFLESHLDVSVVGSNLYLFENNGDEDRKLGITKFPFSSKALFAQLPFSSPLPHPSWMIRKSSFDGIIEYNNDFRSSQDYEFMFRTFLAKKKIACIQVPLVKYRVRNNSISHMRRLADPNTIRVQKEVARLLNISVKDDLYNSINFFNIDENHDFFALLKCLYVYFFIWYKNMLKGIFSRVILTKITLRYEIAALIYFIKNLKDGNK